MVLAVVLVPRSARCLRDGDLAGNFRPASTVVGSNFENSEFLPEHRGIVLIYVCMYVGSHRL